MIDVGYADERAVKQKKPHDIAASSRLLVRSYTRRIKTKRAGSGFAEAKVDVFLETCPNCKGEFEYHNWRIYDRMKCPHCGWRPFKNRIEPTKIGILECRE